jgi:hypothetical protein
LIVWQCANDRIPITHRDGEIAAVTLRGNKEPGGSSACYYKGSLRLEPVDPRSDNKDLMTGTPLRYSIAIDPEQPAWGLGEMTMSYDKRSGDHKNMWGWPN